MSQPDLAFGFWSSNQPSRPEVDPGGDKPPLSIASAEYQALLDQLAQAQVLDHQHLARIYHLEQALDQALTCLDELKLRVHDQEFLEAQLATTEEFAYVQQQAIARLKLQLTQQQQALETQNAQILERDRQAQAILDVAETLTQAQQAELERVRSRLAQDQIQVQADRTCLEQQLENLQNALHSRQQRILELESQSLASSQIKVEELETQLAKQVKQQARWQQNCQELETERDRDQSRIQALEQAASEMQEQILQQVRQASEYEAAVQYWKDRYFSDQQKMIQLRNLLEYTFPQHQADPDANQRITTALAELLVAVHQLLSPEQEDTAPSAPSFSRFPILELPNFLLRRRTYRAK